MSVPQPERTPVATATAVITSVALKAQRKMKH
jgi:hypothetical protein